MNIYFYTAKKSDCNNGCSYKNCSERFIYTLQHSPKAAIQYINNDALLTPNITNPLQSDDLIILHINNQTNLETLVENKKMFTHCRLILILNKEIYKNSKNYHQLNPRFITTSDQNPKDLRNVVYKLIDLMSGWGHYSKSSPSLLPQTSSR